MPFAVLGIIAGYFRNDPSVRAGRRNRFLVSVCIIITILILATIIQFIINSSKERLAEIEYNSARTSLVDYPQKDYAEARTDGIDISENTYIAVTNMIIADTDIVNANFMREVSTYSTRGRGLLYSLYDAYYIMKSLPPVIMLSLVLLAIVYVGVVMNNKELELELIIAISVFLVIVTVLIVRGRLPVHVIETLIVSAFMPISLHCHEIRIQGSRLVLLLFFGIILSSAVIAFAGGRICMPQNLFSAKTSRNTTSLNKFYDDNKKYVWDVYELDGVLKDSFMQNGELLPEEFINNNIPDGEWTYGQRYYNDYFLENGIRNPIKSLVYEDDWYYIGSASRCAVIEKWIQEYYAEDVKSIQVDDFNGIPIWKFVLPSDECQR